MNKPFQSIGIIGKVSDQNIHPAIIALADYLKTNKQAFHAESQTAAILDKDTPTMNPDELAKNCDIIIVVGGDGSMLKVAHLVADHNTPLLGINRGNLGFLTDILPNEFDKISDILQGNYTTEKRFLLAADTTHTSKQNYALNEVVLSAINRSHMLEFEIYIDEQFVCSQRSDGLIITTPTGSTAYALSGGGPILHPALDAIALVPMFPHTLSARPIVVNGQNQINIIVTDKDQSARISCDGQNCLELPNQGQVTINKKKQALTLVHPIDYDYYGALRSKLHWGKKL